MVSLYKKGDINMFEPIQFVHNLRYMGAGMLGVFIIVGIIMAATYAIGKLSAKKKDDADKEE